MTTYFMCKCEKNSLVRIYSLLALYFVLVCTQEKKTKLTEERSGSGHPNTTFFMFLLMMRNLKLVVAYCVGVSALNQSHRFRGYD